MYGGAGFYSGEGVNRLQCGGAFAEGGGVF